MNEVDKLILLYANKVRNNHEAASVSTVGELRSYELLNGFRNYVKRVEMEREQI